VNAAARLQESAAAGELLVAVGVADELARSAQRRTVTLRGREQPLDAFVVIV
jgi:adenylate cyclase